MVWNLLGEGSQRHHGIASALQQLLDRQSVSHSQRSKWHGVSPKDLAKDTVPINKFNVRSIFVRPDPNEILHPGMQTEIEGVAFDSGYGIRRVEVSTDGGANWADARLDPEIGKYSWRRWRMPWTPRNRGQYRLMARATNAVGETQRKEQWNRSGFTWNVIKNVDVKVG